MNVDLFDFELPGERIANRPVRPRDAAKLLHVGSDGAFIDRHVCDLPAMLSPGDIVVVNDARVIPARLKGRRGEAKIEVTLHQRLDAKCWRVFARPAKRVRTGDDIVFAGDFRAHVQEKGEAGEATLRFDSAGSDLLEALERYGEMPLPPYIKRAGGADEMDREDYQTLFAAKEGAVAAPTAGLHFTQGLRTALEVKGILLAQATLYVGAGTFLPVKAKDTRDHKMHFERGQISAEAASAINRAKRAGGRIVAVGTTSARLLESAATEAGEIKPYDGETDLFIAPGYRFRAVDRLLTNFHLPRSTLFMLVSAFAGLERMKSAYSHAIASGYRFYSYGDACFLEPTP
ncbi:S-adenosylmethionine:tRNA ribosyltransferase-isomerase [Alphaproteobacteria bacterium]|nr:S-adenosylmethionine:tRNA ribosyltransferase-isomerase [Alphaproteobacteria bacterium]